MNIEALDDFVARLKSESSRLKKESILKTATEDQKEVLRFLFNPYKVTGISEKKLAGRRAIKTGSGATLTDLLAYLSVHTTGSNADIDFVCEVAGETGYPELVFSIAKKNLTLGVNATTLNKVYGKGFIPTFEAQLAEKNFDNPDKKVPEGTEFIVTEKLDGVRCVLMFDDQGQPHFYARSGREIEGLVELRNEALSFPKEQKDLVYDGELLIENRGDKKSNNLYRDTMSVIGSDGEKRGVIFHLFDALSKESFMGGRCNIPASFRKFVVAAFFDSTEGHMKAVPILYAGTDRNEIMRCLDEVTARGGEGVMINLSDAPYICGRNSGLLKVKRFNECEGIIRSIETGTGKNEGRLGAIIIDIKDEDGRYHKVRVGSGFKDYERDYYYDFPELLIGKVVEIGYFEVTKNKADDSLSLRFPTWLDRIRHDKGELDITPIQ